eukprot:scaffold405_cov132-Cylindrotheca_fusiformis.AAC.25
MSVRNIWQPEFEIQYDWNTIAVENATKTAYICSKVQIYQSVFGLNDFRFSHNNESHKKGIGRQLVPRGFIGNSSTIVKPLKENC